MLYDRRRQDLTIRSSRTHSILDRFFSSFDSVFLAYCEHRRICSKFYVMVYSCVVIIHFFADENYLVKSMFLLRFYFSFVTVYLGNITVAVCSCSWSNYSRPPDG